MNDHESDRALDDQLRAAFAPPPAAAFAEQAARVARPAVHRPFWPWVMAVAALLLVAFLLYERPRRGPEGHDGRELGAMWAVAYEDAVARGFSGGGSCCQPDLDLGKACHDLFACKLELAAEGNVSLLGGYCGLPTGGCMALLAKDGMAPVCVYVVPSKQDPHVALPADCPLHLTRRDLGGLVLYALSRSPSTAALEQFVVPVQ